MSPTLPIVRPLPDGFSIVSVFNRFAQLPGCLWLDSADHDLDLQTSPRGHYSFLTADPIRRLVAHESDCSPWPEIQNWTRALPNTQISDLPPFQGGLAGVIGYEAGSWLEPVGLAKMNDLACPVVSLGLYDWTIAVDHHRDAAWLISQGLGAANQQDRVQVAQQRADQVSEWLTERAAPVTGLPQTSSSYNTLCPQHPTKHNGITSNFSSPQYRDCVAEIVRRIRDGDSFQVNLAQRLLCGANRSSPQLYGKLRSTNPAPFGGYYDGGDFQVLSSSPEAFLTVRDRTVQTRPIKGTIARTGDPQQDALLAERLQQSEKDHAENVMIVDLLRNDLSRVCEDDSVVVRKLCEIETYRYVQHLVSVVEGQLAGNKTVVDLLTACFPGGSITGAPKIEAMRTIAQLEPTHRGPYCGTLGYISCGGSADFNILIRTITAAGGWWQIPVGGGITARSDPAAEEQETWNKAEGMLRAVMESGTKNEEG